MSNRQLVMDLVSKMPEDSPVAAIISRIEFVTGVQEALAESERGEGVEVDEARRLLKSWTSKSS